MTIDIELLTDLVNQHQKVGRVSILSTKGSTPRESGTEMFLWNQGQYGTIGGGALEFTISDICRKRLSQNKFSAYLINQPLGPGLGQCCGGSLNLVVEGFDSEILAKVKQIIVEYGFYFRSIKNSMEKSSETKSLMDKEIIEFKVSNHTHILKPNGLLMEKCQISKIPIWVFGAGHVGQAIVDLLVNLPQFDLNWVDFHETRFPKTLPLGAKKVVAQNPEMIVPYCPKEGNYFVITHSHDLDLKLIDGLIRIDPNFIGLIGSKTKWKRFQKRLVEMGHTQEDLDKITCPIGNPHLGKHPWEIAVGVVAELLN